MNADDDKKGDKSVLESSNENGDVKIDATTDGKTDSIMDTATDKEIGAQKDTSVNENIAPNEAIETSSENNISGSAESNKTSHENIGPDQNNENSVRIPLLDQTDKTSDGKIDTKSGIINDEKTDVKLDIVKDEKTDVKLDIVKDEKTENMDVEEKDSIKMKIPVKRSIEDDAETKENVMPAKRHAGITRLCLDEDIDSKEETVIMTFEEVKAYLVTKVAECITSPVNPLFALQQKAEELKAQLIAKEAEYKKLCQGYKKLHENQEKFLRHAGVLPKIQTNSVNVSVDLPVLPSSFPQHVNLPKSGQQSLLKNNELSITRIDNRQATANTSQSRNTSKNPVIECIDLTDDTDTTSLRKSSSSMTVLKHPAPLPPRPVGKACMPFPPRPNLKVSLDGKGIVLQWDFPRNSRPLQMPIARFEIFGYQETKTAPINTLLWKKIGVVDAMTLPMACTLTQFANGARYHFTIRAVDVKGEHSHYSEVMSMIYMPKIPVTTSTTSVSK